MKEAYIAAKERWAAKMAGKAKPTVRSTNRLPPGQREAHNFPVLDLGIRPDAPLEQWEIKIGGHGGANTEVEDRKVVDRKSTRLNSSHSQTSYAVFVLIKKNAPS